MKADEKTNNKLLWSEIEENKAETISGGHGNRSRFEGINSFVKNTVIVFQTNIVNIIGTTIGGNLTINQSNSSGINQGNRGKR
jgi:hypothetical protein